MALLPALGLFALVRSGVNEDSLRDFHPYLVTLYAMAVAFVMSKSEPHTKRLGLFLVGGALAIHLILVSFRVMLRVAFPGEFQKGVEASIGSGPQIDSLVLAVTALSSLWLAFKTERLVRRLLYFAVASVAVAEVTYLENRGGQLALYIGLLALCALVTWEFARKRSLLPAVRRVMAVIVVGILGTIASPGEGQLVELSGGIRAGISTVVKEVLSTETPSSSQLEETQAPIPNSSEDQADPQPHLQNEPLRGSGTVMARIEAWRSVLTFSFENPHRLLLGNGFDTEYFLESGARVALMGPGQIEEGENRWPHNYLVTLTATTGIAGLFSMLVLQSLAFWYLIRSKQLGKEFLHYSAFIVLLVFSVGSFFGVIWENPWGSIAISWGIGIALATRFRRSE